MSLGLRLDGCRNSSERKKKKRERERERWMVANGITGTVRYGVLLAFPQTVVHNCT